MKRTIALLSCLLAVCSTAFAETPPALSRGDIVFFGHYEQDDISSDGFEAIEWIVLKTDEGTALLISRYALDCVPFHIVKASVTWETCSLRSWLNDTFYSRAFTEEEQARIVISEVSPDPNPRFASSPGAPTQDRVFLLSGAEAETYLRSDAARTCAATPYARKHGAIVNENACWWLLRTPGVNDHSVACVNSNGKIGYGGYDVNRETVALRPAIVLRLSD